MGDNGRFDCIFVHLRGSQWHSLGGLTVVPENPHAQVVVRGDTLGAPLFRRESFIQGVKWRTFVGKSAAADPFLPREDTLCLQEDPSSTQVAARV